MHVLHLKKQTKQKVSDATFVDIFNKYLRHYIWINRRPYRLITLSRLLGTYLKQERKEATLRHYFEQICANVS